LVSSETEIVSSQAPPDESDRRRKREETVNPCPSAEAWKPGER
jgi:hypothetical protein